MTTTIPKYKVLEQKDEDSTATILITEGKFEGFAYNYGVVKVREDEETDQAFLSYDYNLLEAPESYEIVDEFKDKEEFEQLIGDILVDVIATSIEMKDADRNEDSNQSD